MRKLLIYLNEYRKECILAPLFKLLEASFELIVPLVVAAIIDNGIAASNKSYIFKMGGVMVLLALIGLACSITAQYFAAKAAVGFSTKVRYALFFPYSETVFFGNGYHWDFYADHTYDQRYQPDASRASIWYSGCF